MLMALNMGKYITEGAVLCRDMKTYRVRDKVVYILDTDDLSVQSIDADELYGLIVANVVTVNNLRCSKTREGLWTSSSFLDFTGLQWDLDFMGGNVTYVRTCVEHLRPIVVGTTLRVYGTDVHIKFGIAQTGKINLLYKLVVNDKCVVSFVSALGNLAERCGVAYLYKLGDYIVVQYVVIHDFYHCITLVLSMSGELVDAYTKDELFDGVMFESKDVAFHTKLVSLVGGRY